MGLIVDVLVGFIGYGTGQVLLFVFTFGKRKPRWPSEKADSWTNEELIFNGSTWLGYLFWMVVIGTIIYLRRG